jgi:ketosteroid isomerase-like protein
MRRIFSSAILVLTLALGLHAQTAPDAAALTRLLNEFLEGASRNDVAMHDRFWAEELVYTGSAGRRRSKADVMRDVRAAPAAKPGDPKTTYTAEDIRIQQYGNVAIVAFRLVGKTEKDGTTQVSNYLNTGTFLKRKGKWQVVAWQSTKVPSEDTSIKKVAATNRRRDGVVS